MPELQIQNRIQLLSDIVGPGIIIGKVEPSCYAWQSFIIPCGLGYIAVVITTFLIVFRPSAFDGVSNGMASVTMALAYAISSVIQIDRTKNPG